VHLRQLWRSAPVRYALTAALCAVAACVHPHPQPPAGPQPWFTKHSFPAGGRTPFGIVVGDFNGDGRPDLAVSLVADPYVSLLLGTPDGAFVQGPHWPADEASRGMAVADLNHDGKPDLVVASIQNATAQLFFSDGKGGATRGDLPAGLAPFNVDVGDLDGDGNADVVVANESNIPAFLGKGETTVLWGDGHGGFPRRLVLQAGSHPADAKIGDFDGDGRPDVAVVNWKSLDIALFFNRGGATFSAPTLVPYGSIAAYTLAVADLNGDHRPDLVTADVGGVVRVFYNSGGGQFTAAPVVRAGSGTRCVIAADMNGDGVPDLITADVSSDTVTVFLGKPGGGFAPPHPIRAGRQPRVVAAADLNGDGKLDLAVTNDADDTVLVLINNGIGD
jgi:hypothetical protein